MEETDLQRKFLEYGPGVGGSGPLRAQGCGHAVASMGHLCCGDAFLDCRVTAPGDTEKFLVRRAELLRWRQKHIDEMGTGVWFDVSMSEHS